jgi:hypothetical protein
MEFWKQWGVRFAIGNDLWERIVHLLVGISLVILTLVPGLPPAKVTLEIGKATVLTATPLGAVLSATVLVVWAAVSGGISWVLSRGPYLRLGDTLTLDSLRIYRLRVWNDGIPASPKVIVTSVRDSEGNSLVDANHLPIELPWTNIAGRPLIGKNDRIGESVAVAAFVWAGDRRYRPRFSIYIYGQPQPSIQLARLRHRTLAIHISASSPDHPHRQPIDRTYCLTFDQLRANKPRRVR